MMVAGIIVWKTGSHRASIFSVHVSSSFPSWQPGEAWSPFFLKCPCYRDAGSWVHAFKRTWSPFGRNISGSPPWVTELTLWTFPGSGLVKWEITEIIVLKEQKAIMLTDPIDFRGNAFYPSIILSHLRSIVCAFGHLQSPPSWALKGSRNVKISTALTLNLTLQLDSWVLDTIWQLLRKQLQPILLSVSSPSWPLSCPPPLWELLHPPLVPLICPQDLIYKKTDASVSVIV